MCMVGPPRMDGGALYVVPAVQVSRSTVPTPTEKALNESLRNKYPVGRVFLFLRIFIFVHDDKQSMASTPLS